MFERNSRVLTPEGPGSVQYEIYRSEEARANRKPEFFCVVLDSEFVEEMKYHAYCHGISFMSSAIQPLDRE